MEVPIEVGVMPVFAFADIIGQGAYKGQLALLIQKKAFLGSEALLQEHLLGNAAMLGTELFMSEEVFYRSHIGGKRFTCL
jgi:hypothetical protein